MSDRPTYCCGACPAVEPNPEHPDCEACRTIHTREELDALPDGSIIRDHNDGEAMQKIDGDWRGTAGGEGYDDYCPTATVLYAPEA